MPEPMDASVSANQVALNVRVPAQAEVLVEGKKTEQTGMVRRFVSPPLTPGRTYTYNLKAKWTDNGREVVEARTLDVQAGDWLNVDFMAPAQGPMPRRGILRR
jgi:uncharacterized protein (TIGR03000 family)